MTLNVDGLKDEIRQYAPEVDWLVNSFAYVGGMAKDKNIPDAKAENFRGCMKKVLILRICSVLNLEWAFWKSLS